MVSTYFQWLVTHEGNMPRFPGHKEPTQRGTGPAGHSFEQQLLCSAAALTALSHPIAHSFTVFYWQAGTTAVPAPLFFTDDLPRERQEKQQTGARLHTA